MRERVDLVDASGEIQARGVFRDELKAHPERFPGLHMQIIIGVVVDTDNNILVQERAEGKTEAGLIDLISETVQAGEDAHAAACRGIREESGIALADEDAVVLAAEGVNEYNRYCRRYGVRVAAGTAIQPSAEAAWMGWRSLDELEAMPPDAFVAGFFADIQTVLGKLEEGQHGASIVPHLSVEEAI